MLLSVVMMHRPEEAHGLYERKDGAKLACLVRPTGDVFKSVMADSRRGEYVEDSIRLAHYPPGEGVARHASFEEALAHVEKHARRWQRARKRLRRGPGTPFAAGCKL